MDDRTRECCCTASAPRMVTVKPDDFLPRFRGNLVTIDGGWAHIPPALPRALESCGVGGAIPVEISGTA